MDVEVYGESPLDEPRPTDWLRGLRRSRITVVAVAAAVGMAAGFAIATVRYHQRSPSAAVVEPAPIPASGGSEATDLVLAARMVDQVRVYNKTEPATVEVSDATIMTLLRNNVSRLDTARSYPPGDYRLQVICLGDGDVWALFRIGDAESYVDIDCHSDHVLVSQLPLAPQAPGLRTVTLVSDASAGVAVGYQILRTTTT